MEQVSGNMEERMPDYILNEYNLCDINKAIKSIHMPEEFKDFNLSKDIVDGLVSIMYGIYG